MIPTSLQCDRPDAIITAGNETVATPAAVIMLNDPHAPAGAAVAESDPDLRRSIQICDRFVADILKPYRAHARYLKAAEITHWRDVSAPDAGANDPALVVGTGRFSIPESCYIDDTGHFNAVEFNICYNQLAYVLFGKGVEAGIFHRILRAKANLPSFAEFMQHQLPSMLIVRIDDVRFFKQMKSDDFRAELRIEKFASKGGALFFFTSIAFSDCEGLKAQGSVVLAFSPTIH
jgi:hypothetical protein